MTDTPDLTSEGLKIIAILSKEGDRGCVLVTAALLEEAIENQIRARLIAPSDKRDELLSSSPSTPISSFSSKIDLGFRLGLFPESERDIYHQLRRLRNECAHSASEQAFSNISFKTRIENVIAKSENVWEQMKVRFGQQIDHENPPQTVEAFVTLAGWRRAFTLFFSLVIAHKIVYLGRVTRVRGLYERA